MSDSFMEKYLLSWLMFVEYMTHIKIIQLN